MTLPLELFQLSPSISALHWASEEYLQTKSVRVVLHLSTHQSHQPAPTPHSECIQYCAKQCAHWGLESKMLFLIPWSWWFGGAFVHWSSKNDEPCHRRNSWWSFTNGTYLYNKGISLSLSDQSTEWGIYRRSKIYNLAFSGVNEKTLGPILLLYNKQGQYLHHSSKDLIYLLHYWERLGQWVPFSLTWSSVGFPGKPPYKEIGTWIHFVFYNLTFPVSVVN